MEFISEELPSYLKQTWEYPTLQFYCAILARQASIGTPTDVSERYIVQRCLPYKQKKREVAKLMSGMPMYVCDVSEVEAVSRVFDATSESVTLSQICAFYSLLSCFGLENGGNSL